jgi:hypothetical protein
LLPILNTGFAAQTTGILEGLIYDPSGRVIQGAAVEIISVDMGTSRRVVTDAGGRYQALNLNRGTYEIEVSHPGFRGETRQSIELTAGRAIQMDFRLTLGEPQEKIVVNAETPLLSTRTSDWGSSIENQKLENFPLKGRDLFDLAALTPGASITSTAKLGISTGWGIHLSINGGRPSQNSFRLDGIYINDAASTAPASASGGLLGIEGVSELRIVSSPFSAEYGRTAGGVITAISKSGSNQLHGSVYEFARNSRLDAKNYFDPAGEKIPPLHRNQFGGSLGGPLRANSLFFFANYEGIRSTASKTQTSNTLTEEARQGILPTATGTRQVAIAPAVLPYMDLYPMPNGDDFGDGTAEFLSEVTARAREDMFSGRMDYNLSGKWRLFGRFTFNTAETSTTDPFRIWIFPSDSRYHFIQTDAQYMQGANAIHTFHLGFSRIRNAETYKVRGDIPETLSFVPGRPLGVIDVTGLTSLGGQTARVRPRRFVTNDLQISYDGTYIWGEHTFRFGGSFDRIHFNQQFDINSSGLYKFSSIADFLQAKANSGDLMLPGSDSIRGWRQSQFSGFIQDDYRIGPNLTASLGVRYETYTTPNEVNGKVASIPDPLHDRDVTVGGPLFKNPSSKNFAPRASVAWDPFGKGKTTVRAGAGIFFDLLGMRELAVAGARMPPFFNRVTMQRVSFPSLIEAVRNTTPELGPDSIEFRPSQPYTAQFQLSIEHEIMHNMVIRAAYAGTRGVHLPGQVGNINPPVPVTLDDGSLYFPEGSPRLNPAFGRIIMRRMQFNSFYHAFHAELQRRWTSRWGFQMKYTWSKSMDDTSTAIFSDFLTSDQIPTMFSYRQNRGLSDFDLRHMVAANVSYRLPALETSALRQVFSGWEIHGLMQAQSGYPFSPFVGFDRARINPGSDDLGQRPDLAAAPGMKLILGDPQKYFNDQAFALPAAGQYGNLGRNTLTGPGLVSIDLALHKAWHVESHTLRLRVEAFNLPNRPNFQVPSGLALFNSSLRRLGSAGRITSTSTPSRQIQIGLKWAF